MKKKIAFLLMFFLMLPNGVFALEENEEQKTNGVEEQTSNSLASEFDEHNGFQNDVFKGIPLST